MNVIGPGPGTDWPIAVFEQDGHAHLIHSQGELADAYDDTYWDEISYVFDRSAHQIDVLLSPDIGSVPPGDQYVPDMVLFRGGGGSDVSLLAALARDSLKRVSGWRFVFPVKASKSQAEELDGMSDDEVVSFYFSVLRKRELRRGAPRS